MAKRKRRISNKISQFNIDITSMDDTLQATSTDPSCVATPVWQCLGVASADAADWHTSRQNWDTPVTGLYPRYNNPLTKHLVDGKDGDVQVFIRDFQKFSTRPLNAAANSPKITPILATILHVVPTGLRALPTHMTQKIAETCILAASHKARGVIAGLVRTSHDAIGRSSIPVGAGANSVEILYNIIPQGGSKDPADPYALRTAFRFSTADFEMVFGGDNSGLWVQLFPHWINIHYPQFASDFGEMIMMVIP